MTDFAVYYIKNPGPFYLVGRITTSMFSIGSIIFTYLTARLLLNWKVALVSALLLSVSFGHVMVAKDIKADTPCMFFTIVSAYFVVRYMKEKTIRQVILSAIFAGIGTATKYYSMVMLIPIFFALLLDTNIHHIKSIAHSLKIFLLCVLSFTLFYFICSPYSFLDPLGRKSSFGGLHPLASRVSCIFVGSEQEGQPVRENISDYIGGEGVSFSVFKEGLFNYALKLKEGLSLIILLMSIFGFVYSLTNLTRMYFVFILFPFLFGMISIFLYPGYSQIRHQIILYPFIIIPGAFLAVKCLEVITKCNKLGCLLVGILLLPITSIVQYNTIISREDTRNIAKAWIEGNIPAGSKVLIDENGPQLYMNEENILSLLQEAEQADPRGQFTAHYDTYLKYQLLGAKDTVTYDLHEIRFPWWRESEIKKGTYRLTSEFDRDMGNPLKSVGVENYDYYVKSGFEFAVVHSHKYAHFLRNNEVSRKFPSFARFYRELFKRSALVKEISPLEGKRKGPAVKILKFL